MGTRCNLIIEDGYDRIQLYRHWDGYPEDSGGVLATLKEALPYAWALPRFEASDFAAAIVRAWKQEGGGNIYIDGSPEGYELLHGDIEWLYVIRQAENDILIEVYDWHAYWFGKQDPTVIPPEPYRTVYLSEVN